MIKRKLIEKTEDPISPELKLRQAADEGAELLGAARGEGGTIVERMDLGVHLRRQKRYQQLKDVDSQSVGDNVEPLHKVDAQRVYERDRRQEDPPVQYERRRFVEQMLVPSPQHVAELHDGGGRGIVVGSACAATGIHCVFIGWIYTDFIRIWVQKGK